MQLLAGPGSAAHARCRLAHPRQHFPCGSGTRGALQVRRGSSSSSSSSRWPLVCRAGAEQPGQRDEAAAAPHSSDGSAAADPQQTQTQPKQPTAAKQKQKQKPRQKQLDVSRAVQLLKLTASRSEAKGSSGLPPWFMRTQDDAAQGQWADEEPAAGSASSSSSSSNGSSSTAAEQAPASPLVARGSRQPAADAPTSSQSGGSRWQQRQQQWQQQVVQSRRSGSPERRMFSASDPIRRDTRGDWASVLPWQEGGDTRKEEERQFRRAVFSFDRWAAHRSTWRYWRHFRGIGTSRTLQGLLPAVAFFTGVAALAGLYNTAGVAAGAPVFTLSRTSLDVTAFAVSLLLVFRTDSSYERYMEGLQAWNEVRSLSKDLARQACYWVADSPRKGMLIRWSEAFSRALLVHCRVDGSLDDELQGVLQPQEVAALAAVGPGGAPSFVLQVISEVVEQCALSEIKEDKMFLTLRQLGDKIAVCDKLLRYPLPLAWSRHISRFMSIWLCALPWAMWADDGWSVVPLTGVVSYLLLGIDEIGVQLEEPFGVLPCEDVCVDIQAEVEAMVERQDLVTDLLTAGGVDCQPRSTCGECGQPVAAAAAADA